MSPVISFIAVVLAACLINGEETPCSDLSSLCVQLTRFCGDGVHDQWMESHCARSCKYCGQQGETETTQAPPIKTKAPPPPRPIKTKAPPPPRPIKTKAPPPPEPEVPSTTAPKPQPKVLGNCGKPQIIGDRIVGGKAAVPGSWPWQILLLFSGYPGCGGSIISAEWVVTAAHCVFQMEKHASDFTVRTGEYDRDVLEGTEQEYDVENIIRHPQYNPSNLNNDIALLKLKSPIMFDKYRSPVCLPSKSPKVGSNCYITGWGKMKHTGQMVKILQQGKLPIVSQQTCNKLNLKNIGIRVTDAMICAGSGGSSNLSGCHGDSGGPFVCEDGGRWFLQGAVSHGSSKCSSTESYTVFAKITHFKEWIESNMRSQ